MRVLVIGATGGTRRQLVQQALDQGHQVTAFVRDPSKLQIEHANLRVVKGDVLDYASVEPAMRGQSAVLCALGHKRFFYPNKIQSNGMRTILRTMKACDVPRLICETALGIGVRPGVLTNGDARGTYRHGPRVGSYLWPVKISRAAVADFMLKQLTDDACVGAAPAICW